MELVDLAKLAIEAINQKSQFGTGKPGITLQMSPPQKHERPERKLVPRGKCPVGTVLSRMDEYDVVIFDAVDVLAWCVANSDAALNILKRAGRALWDESTAIGLRLSHEAPLL